MFTCACTCGDQKVTSDIFIVIHLFFETLNLELTVSPYWLDWLGSDSLGSAYALPYPLQ